MVGGNADATAVVVVYGVLFMDWGEEFKSRSRDGNAQPFQGVILHPCARRIAC